LNILRAPVRRTGCRPANAACRNAGAALLLQRALQGRHTTMTLKQLFEGIDTIRMPRGKEAVRVHSITTDSRRAGPGCVFFAVPGLRTDGHFFIAEAIDRGAVAIVSEKDTWVPPNVALVQADDLRAVIGEAASRFYGHPARDLSLTGFLGTSGKTVASTLLRHFLREQEPVGLIGTIHYAVGNRTLPAHRTTPEPIELQGLLSQMRQQECRQVLLEVSAHGIHQRRVEGLDFRNLVLMNLTPEHLQYHGSLERYIALERTFIVERGPRLRTILAGIDDPGVRGLVESLPPELHAKVVTFGQSPEADFRAEEIDYSARDTRFRMVWPGGSLKLVSPLLGEFNVQNALAAIACGTAEGLEPGRMGAALLEFGGVRGRMERLECGQSASILIDYMHTEAAYAKGLEMVRAITRGRLITVFGCGGNRDAASRPRITALVAEKSDLAIATADNPRNEAVSDIFDDMRRGNEALPNLTYLEDRRSAIAAALEAAGPGDTVLIAGKGHETFQEFGDCVVPFDDRAVAREILHNRQWRQQ
jgi:UDP-N-acetylmuramoyl-L-alanyl-D-glutamate--2,6-diaminopimelate ligase